MNAINSINFTSKYQINANMKFKDDQEEMDRDTMVGVWAIQAKNSSEVLGQLADFSKNVYKSNPDANCILTLDIPDERDAEFEKDMNKVKQPFDKIV